MKDKIVNIAITKLGENTQLYAVWNPLKIKDTYEYDGELTLKFNNEIICFVGLVKKEFRRINLHQVFELYIQYTDVIVIAETIYPNARQELMEKGIAYLDNAGNAFMKKGGFYLYIDGKKNETDLEKIRNRAFTKTGLKIIFHLLQDETFINRPYREIAQLYDIAPANINYIIKDLIQQNLLIYLDKRKLKVIDKKNLLQKWITAYEANLKPKIYIGNFHFLKNEDYLNWKTIHLKNPVTQWGGEPAAELLTKYLKAEILTIYTNDNIKDLIKNYRLVPDIAGKVQVYQKFWKFEEINNNTVPHILVYADLINTGNTRNIETAMKLYNDYLIEIYG